MGTIQKNQRRTGVREWLRAAAEDHIAEFPEKTPDTSGKTPEEIIYELEVHQIELEIQNEELKEAHMEIQESRDRFIELYDFAPVGYFTLTQKGLITQVNLTGAALLGVVRNDLIHARFRSLIPLDQRDVWDNFFLHVLKQATKQTCLLCLPRGETMIHVRIEGIQGEGGEGVFQVRLTVSDISDLEQAENALSENEERFRLLFQEAPFPYLSLDADGRILEVNEAWLEALGYNLDEVINHWFEDFLPLDQKSIFRQHFLDFKNNGQTHDVLFSMQKKDGEIIFMSLTVKIGRLPDGSFRQIHGVFQDVTTQKRAEDALRKSEEKFRTLFSTMETGVYYRCIDSTLVDCNPAALKMLGFTREEFLTWTPMHPRWQFIHADGTPLPSDEQPSMIALLTGKPVRDIIAGIYHPDIQKYIWVSIDAVPQFRPGEGEPYQVFVTLHDITSQKEAEEKLKSSLAEKEVLLREIHHRVKNNLSTIISLINLQTASFSSDSDRSHFQDLEARIQSMAMIYESLNLTDNISQIPIQSYITNLVQYLTQIYQIRQDIQFQFNIDPILISLDNALPCGLIINEIITNALKYAFPPGFFGEEKRGSSCMISIGMKRDGMDLVLSIADNGIGMLPVISDSQRGIGKYLINLIVSHELQGSVTTTTTEGTQYMIRFPELRDDGERMSGIAR